MLLKRSLICTVMIITLISGIVVAQPLKDLSRLEIKAGLFGITTNDRIAETELTTLEVESQGLKFGAGYSYFLKEHMSLTFSVDLLVAEVKAGTRGSGVTSETSIIIPVLFGIRYYFPGSTNEKAFRPYAIVQPGMFFGSQQRSVTETGSVLVASKSSAAFGGYVGLGIDYRLGSLFIVGAGAGYYAMSKFDEPIGGSKDYSGPEGHFNFSFLFGKR